MNLSLENRSSNLNVDLDDIVSSIRDINTIDYVNEMTKEREQ